MYLIVNCPHCGRLMMANSSNRTRKCPNCSFRSDIFTLKIVASTQSSRKAVEIIQQLKADKKGKGTTIFKRFKN